MSEENLNPEPESTWRDSLPEDLRDSAALKDVTDVGSLAKQFVDQQSYLGNSIRIPGEDAGDEDRAAFTQKLLDKAPNLMMRPNFEDETQKNEFFRTLGMPEEASGYELPEIEGVDMVDFGDDRLQMLQGIAHKAGVTKDQFSTFMSEALQADVAAAQEYSAQMQEGMNGLKGEWGHAYDDRLATAAKIAEDTGAPSGLIEGIKNGSVGAETYKWLFQLSQQLGGEQVNLANQTQAPSGHLSPQEAQTKIDEIMNNKEHPYWNNSHPGHKDALNKMVKLMQYKNPGSTADINTLRV